MPRDPDGFTDEPERPRRRDEEGDEGRLRDYDEYDFRRGRVDVPNYLVQAILCTLCCCMPAGIVAIIFAAQVDAKAKAGDVEGAERASSTARTWCWVSFGLGLIGGPIVFALRMAAEGGMR
jgi:hypothetical protein